MRFLPLIGRPNNLAFLKVLAMFCGGYSDGLSTLCKKNNKMT